MFGWSGFIFHLSCFVLMSQHSRLVLSSTSCFILKDNLFPASFSICHELHNHMVGRRLRTSYINYLYLCLDNFIKDYFTQCLMPYTLLLHAKQRLPIFCVSAVIYIMGCVDIAFCIAKYKIVITLQRKAVQFNTFSQPCYNNTVKSTTDLSHDIIYRQHLGLILDIKALNTFTVKLHATVKHAKAED